MRLLEILIMTLAGVWQGVRQDFNLLEVALIAGGWWAWKKGWHPRYPAWLRIPQAWLRHPRSRRWDAGRGSDRCGWR